MLLTVLGFDEGEIHALKDAHLHAPAASLVASALHQWRDRFGRQASIGALVTALRQADLQQTAGRPQAGS